MVFCGRFDKSSRFERSLCWSLVVSILASTLSPQFSYAGKQKNAQSSPFATENPYAVLESNPDGIKLQSSVLADRSDEISSRKARKNKAKRAKYRANLKARKALDAEQLVNALEPAQGLVPYTPVQKSLSSRFTPPPGTSLILFSLALPALVAAQSTGMAGDGSTGMMEATGSEGSSVIDATVACIVAREVLEGTMFGVSHFGAVLKHPSLSRDEKQSYMKTMVPAIVCGVAAGGVISIGVGFGVKDALDKSESVSTHVELGEAISKTIGAFFVSGMTLKIPKWFGISNYQDDLRNGAANGANQESSIGSRLSLSMSLFWNTLREASEGGILTALAVLLSQESMDALGPSVGLGVGAAAALGVGFGLGAKYISPKGFGIAAASISELLAIGLVTGAVRSYEEFYAENHDGSSSAIIWDYEDTNKGYVLSALEAVGLSDEWTAAQLGAWVSSATLLTGLQVWHNYLGKPLLPKTVRGWIHKAKATISAPFKSCWNKICAGQSSPVYSPGQMVEQQGKPEVQRDLQSVDLELGQKAIVQE